MPEENVQASQNQTETAPAEAQAQEPAANTAAEQKPAETAKTAEEKPIEKVEEKQAEPELTIDSYKDLISEDFRKELSIDEEGLKAFKEIGLKNKIAPEALKAITEWSLNETKKQQDAFKAVQEQWAKENAEKYGDNLKNVQTQVGRVLAQMDKSGKFASLLKDAGAEQHPATLEFLSAIGDVLLEKGSVNPNASVQGKEMTLEDMYKPKN